MEDNKTVKITFEVDGIEKTVSSIDDAKVALKGLETQAKNTEKAAENAADELSEMGSTAEDSGKAGEGAMKVLDEVTGGLATKVKEVGGGFLAMGKKAVTAFKGAVKGANSMGKALIATGIGAIVVAVGLLVAYWDDIKGLVSGVSSEQKKLLADTEATRDAAAENLAATEASENSLKLAGKSEREIRELKIAQTAEIITATEAILVQQKQQKEAQVAAAQRNRDIAQGIIRFLTLPITMLLKTVDMMTAAISKIPGIDIATNLEEGFSGGIAEMLFDPEEVAKEGDATIAETEKQLAALKNKKDGYILAGKESDAKAAENRKQIEQELNDELERLRAENIEGEEARALALLEIEKRKQEEELKLKGASKELLLELDKNYEAQKAAIEDQFREQREAKEAEEAAKKKANQDIINEALKQAGLDSLEDAAVRAQKELEIQRQADIEKLTQAGATAEQLAIINKSNYAAKSKKLAEEEAAYKEELRKQELNNNLNGAKGMLDSITDLAGEGSCNWESSSNCKYHHIYIPISSSSICISCGYSNCRSSISTNCSRSCCRWRTSEH